MSTPRGPQLATIADLTSFLAKITREAYLDKMPMRKATGLAYLVAQLKACMEASELEQRVEELERHQAQRNGSPARPMALVEN